MGSCYNIFINWGPSLDLKFGKFLEEIEKVGIYRITLDFNMSFLIVSFCEGDNQIDVLYTLSKFISFLQENYYEIKSVCLDGLEEYLSLYKDTLKYKTKLDYIFKSFEKVRIISPNDKKTKELEDRYGYLPNNKVRS